MNWNPWNYWPMSITMWVQFGVIVVLTVAVTVRAIRERCAG